MTANAFRPQNIKQKAEQNLTQLAQFILSNQNNPQVIIYRQILRQMYIQIAQRIDISPEVRQLVSQAIGSDVANIGPAVSGINGLMFASMSIGTFAIGGPLGMSMSIGLATMQSSFMLNMFGSAVLSMTSFAGFQQQRLALLA